MNILLRDEPVFLRLSIRPLSWQHRQIPDKPSPLLLTPVFPEGGGTSRFPCDNHFLHPARLKHSMYAAVKHLSPLRLSLPEHPRHFLQKTSYLLIPLSFSCACSSCPCSFNYILPLNLYLCVYFFHNMFLN